MALQIRRGTDAERQLITPLQGELIFTTDTKRLYVGDGTTLGGVAVDTAGTGGGAGVLNDLTDVTISSLSTGQVLKWNGTAWVNSADNTGTTISSINDIADVTITSPTSGQVLKWNGSQWVNGTDLNDGSGSLALGDLTNVSITTPTTGQVLKWSGTAWVNSTDETGSAGSLDLEDLENVIIETPESGQVLKYNGTIWVNSNEDPITELSGSVFSTVSTLLVDGDAGRIVGPVYSDLYYDDLTFLINRSTRSLSINTIDSQNPQLEVTAGLIINTEFPESLVLNNAENTTAGDKVSFRKARGTLGSPTSIVNGDELGSVDFLGYDGSTYGLAARILASANGTISSGVTPSKLSFIVRNSLGELKNPFEVSHRINDGRASILLNRERGSVNSPSAVALGDTAHELSFRSYDGEKYLEHANINVIVGGAVSVNNVPSTLNFSILHPSGTFITPFQIANTGTLSIFKDFYDNPLLRVFQSHETQDAANIEFFRSRGEGTEETSILANDDIIDFTFSAYNNGAFRISSAIKVKAVSLVGNRVVSTFSIGMDNGTAFGERFVLESSGVVDFKQTALVAGGGSGQVDTSAPVNYMRVKLNGTEYAMPLFAINP